MKVQVSERSVTRLHSFKAPLRVRNGKSAIPEGRTQSEDLLEKEILFATDSLIHLGTTVEILLTMPEGFTGDLTTEWLCSGHVVRVEPDNSSPGKLGDGVQFDCSQISRPQTT